MATATVLMTCLIISMIMVHSICNGAPTIANNQDKLNKTASEGGAEMNGTYKYPLLKNGVFEGDIMISEELIRKYYNLSSIPGGEKYYELVAEEANDAKDKAVETTDREGKQKFEKRAARAYSYFLWPNASVPYRFTSTVQTELRHRIRDAMDHWEDRTCLRFTTRDAESDYVEYNNEKRACQSYVGRGGGNQTINVDLYCSFGNVVHEVGHAIGFWHEQSRPDRDSYVRINVGNIKEERESDFMKKRDNEVNSLGVVYDYGSIMHYSKTAFVRDDCRARGDGCQSIEITNTTAYRAQGSPTIGQRNGLSTKDVQQTNLLYSCPRSGVTGLLEIHIKSGRSLPVTAPDVGITAVDSSGVQYIRNTSVKLGTTSPNWNEFLKLPKREWQFFRMKLWDGGDEISVSETIVPSLGKHENIRHCADSSCTGYVSYDYQLTSASLSVNVRYARNLQDTDPIWKSPIVFCLFNFVILYVYI